jgi:two-component system cell cycle response regulator
LSEPKARNRTPNNRVHSIGCRKLLRKKTVETVLSAAFVSDDAELDLILRELGDLSKSIKAGTVNPDAADATIRRAAFWAAQKSLLDREVRSLAITDDLTGIFNRRGFLAYATQQLKLAHRDMQNVLLFFLDVDNLKGINDSLGHREGDLALIRTADALDRTFRDSDVLARLGGDEFAVLAWEASIPDVQLMLSRLKENLEQANAEGFQYRLALSVGVARYDPQYPASIGELMDTADQDMYKHKIARIRVVAAALGLC